MRNKMYLLAILGSFLLLACDDDSSSNNANNVNNVTAEICDDTLDNDGDGDTDCDDTDCTAATHCAVNNVNNVNNTNNVTNPACAALVDGNNTGFMVGQTARTFYLKIPTGTAPATGWPVVFAWHGVGDTADNFRSLVEPQVNNAVMPFIAVTPDNDPAYGMNGLPPAGIDWDILNLNDGSADALLFDAVLACLEERWGIDEDHVHAVGFSAGSIMADSLGLLRNEAMASIFTWSGAYLGFQNNKDDMEPDMAGSMINWPAFSTTNKYAQVIVHGADGDETCPGPENCDKYTVAMGMMGTLIANFNHMGVNDAASLPAAGHDVIHCSHAQGHIVSGPSAVAMVQFFADHPRGTVDSPYSAALPTSLSGDICTFVPKAE